jgi:hypothetical protein
MITLILFIIGIAAGYTLRVWKEGKFKDGIQVEDFT